MVAFRPGPVRWQRPSALLGGGRTPPLGKCTAPAAAARARRPGGPADVAPRTGPRDLSIQVRSYPIAAHGSIRTRYNPVRGQPQRLTMVISLPAGLCLTLSMKVW